MTNKNSPNIFSWSTIILITAIVTFGSYILLKEIFTDKINPLVYEERQILEVLNKSFDAVKNKDIAALLDCYSIDSPYFREKDAREGIIDTMIGIKKVSTRLQNIEIKFRKDSVIPDPEPFLAMPSVSLRETTESLWWYGFINKQVHPNRVYSFKKEKGKWKIFLITDHSTGEEYVNSPEVIMETALKALSSPEIIKVVYSFKGEENYLDSADTRLKFGNIVDKLIEDFKKVTELDKYSAEGYFYLGSMFAVKEKFAEAEDSLKKAIKISRDDNKINYKLGNRYFRAMLHCSLGQIYLRQDKIINALSEFRAAVRFNPKYSQAYEFISRIYQRAGDIQNSRIYRLKAFRFNPLFKMEPTYPESINRKAQELFSMAEFHPSQKEVFLKQAIQIDSRFVLAQYYLGLMYSEKNEWQKAIDCMNEVIALDHNQEDPYWELGAIYGKIYNSQREKRDLELSSRNFKKAIRLNPYVHELYGSLALNYFFIGDFNKAVTILRKAKALLPNDPNVNFYMGMFLKKQLDSNIFITDKKKNEICEKEIVPLLQSALDFCTDNALRADIEYFINFLIGKNDAEYGR